MIENNFENLFNFSLIFGGLLWTLAVIWEAKNRLFLRITIFTVSASIFTVGFVIGMMDNKVAALAAQPVPEDMIWVLVFWGASLILISLQIFKEQEKENAWNPAVLPGHGIFIPESNSFRLNGRNLIWLREPTCEKGTEKVYELPRDQQIMLGQVITIQEGATEIT